MVGNAHPVSRISKPTSIFLSLSADLARTATTELGRNRERVGRPVDFIGPVSPVRFRFAFCTEPDWASRSLTPLCASCSEYAGTIACDQLGRGDLGRWDRRSLDTSG